MYLWGVIGAFKADQELLAELNLPEGFIPASSLALGYPNEPLTYEKELKHTIGINTVKQTQ